MMKVISKIFLIISIIMLMLSSIAFAQREGFGDLASPQPSNHKVDINVHVNGIGWMGPFHENDIAGTMWKSKFIDMLSISVKDGTKIRYRVYVEGLGWSSEVPDGTKVGTIDENRPITAIEIKSDFDGSKIICVAHARYVGWLPPVEANKGIVDALENQIEAIKINVIPNDGTGDDVFDAFIK